MNDNPGGDNVLQLFKDTPSAKPVGPQAAVVKVLEGLLADAVSGRVVGLAVVGFLDDGVGGYISGTAGKIRFNSVITGLETLKHDVIAKNRFRELDK